MNKMEQMQVVCWLWYVLIVFCHADFPVEQAKTNVWVTLAKAAGSDAICLSNSEPEKPFSTCLVGAPVKELPLVKQQSNGKPGQIDNGNDPTLNWNVWAKKLSRAASEPQELGILGSLTMDFCFSFTSSSWRKGDPPKYNVTPYYFTYRNLSFWCNSSNSWDVLSEADQYPRQLPKGYWFICGDRAWQGIPAHLEGGPCSIGMLTVIAPTAKEVMKKKQRRTRSVHHYDENCRSDFMPWKATRRVSASIFLPQWTSAVALKQLDRVGCWLSKQTNATSSAISDMLTDVDSVRHATLQNRAAINFLLLAQGLGCEEFEGLCCMNLSDHSESIHKSIQKLKDLTAQIKEDGGSWIDDLFRGWNVVPWLRQLCKIGLYVLGVLVVILIVIPCILHCVRRILNKTVREIFVIQEKELGSGITESVRNLTENVDEGIEMEEGFELRPWNRQEFFEQ